MFIEITKEAWNKLQKKLDDKGFTDYEASDCTLPGDSVPHVHIEFGLLSKERRTEIAKDVDASYEEVAKESDAPKEVRRRKWDEKFHTPGQEAAGWFTGKNMEEEVTYE